VPAFSRAGRILERGAVVENPVVVGQKSLARPQPELETEFGESQAPLQDLQGPELAARERGTRLLVADFNVIMHIANGEFSGGPRENGILRDRRFTREEFSPAIKVEKLIKAGQQVVV